MPVICPTVTVSSPHDYRQQIENVQAFARRIHLDFADGILAPTVLVPPAQAWWPEGLIADFHVMYQRPMEQIETIISQKPDLVILHAEADDVEKCLEELKRFGLKVGLALLPQTTVETATPLLKLVTHALVFGGRLGSQGSEADLDQLEKVRQLKNDFPAHEIAWDGGINDANTMAIARAGVDVLNVGGFIQKAGDPKAAYATLEQIITGV